MGRRSLDTGDNRRSKRSSAAPKVGSVFAAGARRSTRSSTVAATNSSISINTRAGKKRQTLTPSTGNADEQSASGENASEGSSEPMGRPLRRSLRDRKGKESKGSPAPVSTAKEAEENVPPAPNKSTTPARGTPPVGWVYEVVTSAQDLVPKKAFIIDKELDDFKCTQENCNKSFRKGKLLESHLKHYHNIKLEAKDALAPTEAIQSPNPEVATTPSQSADERRRPQARRNRAAASEQSHIEENTVVAATMTSSSTKPSDSAVVEENEEPQSSQSRTKKIDNSPVDECQSPKTRTPSGNISESNAAALQASSASKAVPVGVRNPAHEKNGQKRSVQTPESRVRGPNKQNAVKTQRVAQSGSAPVRKRQLIPNDRSEKPKRRHGDEHRRVENAENVSRARKGLSLGNHAPPKPKKDSEISVEKDVIHCSCGIEEEIGLMIQCGVCLCWQHGCCFGLENKENIPERYVCIACRNARRVMQKQSHKQAAFRAIAEGRVPSLISSTSDQPCFRNVTNIAKTMTDLRKALRGIEIRVLRVYQDTDRPLTERRAQLDAATADAESVQRQMNICEQLLANIDKPKKDQADEASTLRDTVKAALEHLRIARKLPLYRHLKSVKSKKTKRNRVSKPKKDATSVISQSDSQQK